MDEIKSKPRNLSLDVVRSLAILLVVLCHLDKSPLPDWLEMLLKAASLFGVPLFVMLTGFLMLDREYSGGYLEKYVRRNLLPMLIAYELWNVIWCVARQMLFGFDSSDVVRHVKIALFIGQTGTSFWYMQMIVGLYLGIPVLAWTLKQLERPKARLYTIVLLVGMAWFGLVVPTYQQLDMAFGWGVTVAGVIDMNVFGSGVWGGSVWVCYLVAGYMLKRAQGREKAFRRRPCLLIGLLVTWILCALVIGMQMRCDTYSAAYGSVLVALPAICLFSLLLGIDWESRCPPTMRQVIFHISFQSFGVYMVHTFVLDGLENCLDNIGLAQSSLTVMQVYVMTLVISYLIVWALSLIPPLRLHLMLLKGNSHYEKRVR